MAKSPVKASGDDTPIFEVWKAYEEVAMHFNDLLLKLRIQALAGVAALAVLASIFSNFRSYFFQGTWVVAAACFFGLLLVWSAIWALDRLYYNRLLIGSVVAITKIEELSKTQAYVNQLDLSTRIEQAVSGNAPKPMPRLLGVDAFYSVVFALLSVGFITTTYLACNYPPREDSPSGETKLSPAYNASESTQPHQVPPFWTPTPKNPNR